MAKTYNFFIAVTYVDEDIDVIREADYAKAASTARRIWADALDEWRKTKETGVLGVSLFDFEGRLLWSHDNDLGTVGHLMDRVRNSSGQFKRIPA